MTFNANGPIYKQMVSEAIPEVPEEEEIPAPEPTGNNLSSMTVAQLKEYALDNDIDLSEATLKADIITTIENAE